MQSVRIQKSSWSCRAFVFVVVPHYETDHFFEQVLPQRVSPMSTFAIRSSLLRSFSSRPARFPIETIVTTFVLVTFAYFQVIHAIKHSDFLSGGITTNPLASLRPTIARYSAGGGADHHWHVVNAEQPQGHLSYSNSSSSVSVDLVEILFSLDEPRKVVRGSYLSASITTHPSAHSGSTLTASSPQISNAIRAFTEHITKSLTTSNGLSYQSLCYKPPPPSSSSSTTSNECPVWVHKDKEGRTITVTLALLPSTRAQFVAALEAFRPSPTTPNGDVPHFEIIGKEETFLDMQSGKWVAYAARAFVIRFWDLAKVSLA